MTETKKDELFSKILDAVINNIAGYSGITNRVILTEIDNSISELVAETILLEISKLPSIEDFISIKPSEKGNIILSKIIKDKNAAIRLKDLGGFKYLADLQQTEIDKQNLKEVRELEAHEANINTSQATVDAAESAKISKKWSIIGIIVSSCFAFISLLFNAYQIKDSSIKDDSIKEINKILKRQDSLLLIQQKFQPKIDSLLKKNQLIK